MLDRLLYKALLALVLMVLTTAGAAAQNHITGIQLSRSGDNTLVSIFGEGPIRIAHQSVEAKDGKPFRIVIDCLAARHALPQAAFSDLPPSVVTSIRTSQYAVQPEEVVRIVIDTKNRDNAVYRVETDGSVARVYVNDPTSKKFETWTQGQITPLAASDSPASEAKPQAVAQKNNVKTATADSDQKQADPEPAEKYASGGKPVPLQFKSKNTVSPQENPPKPTAAKPAARVPSLAKKENNISKTDQRAQVERSVKQDNQVKTPAVAKKPQSISLNQKQAGPEPNKIALKPGADQVMYGPFPPAGLKPAAKVSVSQKEAPDSPQLAETKTGQKQPPAPGRDPGKPAQDIHKQPGQKVSPELAQVDKDNTDKDGAVASTATSKYRRSTAKSRRMKQTQVVQFPQRMVIKYQTESNRDPFKNLIHYSKGSGDHSPNSAFERTPNAEALRLVGILKSVEGKSAALLEDLDGIGYILKPGDRVQKGYLSQISNNSVFFQVNEYGWTRTVKKVLEKE